MKTDEIQRAPRSQDPFEASRALRELAPLGCTIVDRHGRSVPLTSAGFLLRSGQSYRLRIATPFADDELREIKIVAQPDFVDADSEVRDLDEKGRTVHSIPFKVQLNFLSQMKSLGIGVHCDEFEVQHYFREGLIRYAPPYLCPIVVKPWGLVALVAVVLGIAGFVLERLVRSAFSEDMTLGEMLQSLFLITSVSGWVKLLLIVLGAWLLVHAINLGLLYQRSKALRAQFREKYPHRIGNDA